MRMSFPGFHHAGHDEFAVVETTFVRNSQFPAARHASFNTSSKLEKPAGCCG